MTDDFREPAHARTLAAALAICGLATLTLLANHPGGGAQSFAEVLKAEARDQAIAGIVHGGFIGTLAALIVCFVLLCRYLGQYRLPVVIGFVAFCIGSGAMMASLIVDGFVVPAVAVRFSAVGASDNLASARTILVLCGTLIRFLMPMAMAFQGIALVGISSCLLRRRGAARAAGIYGLLVGILLSGAVFAAPPGMAEHVLLIGIVLQALWYLAIAAAVFRESRDGDAASNRFAPYT